jgi:hypothetical protein
MKTITITKESTLGEISSTFSKKFPYLKIKFFKGSHTTGEASALKDELDYALTINEAGNFDHEETLSVDGHLKVSTLEQRFQDLFEIDAQVFRRSGGVWLQTTATDEWTLTKQNQEGHDDSQGTHSNFSEFKID